MSIDLNNAQFRKFVRFANKDRISCTRIRCCNLTTSTYPSTSIPTSLTSERGKPTDQQGEKP